MALVEKIVAVGLVLGILIRDAFGLYMYDQGILIFGTLLGVLYLVGYWWVNKPGETSFRTISLMLLYGLAFWCLVFALVFKLLFLPGADELSLIGTTLFMGTVVVDFLTSRNNTKVINRKAVVRLVMLGLVVGLYSGFSEEKRVKWTYRNNPEFLKYYELKKDSFPDFYELQQKYFENEELKDNDRLKQAGNPNALPCSTFVLAA